MKRFQSGVLLFVFATGLAAQAPEPPLAEARLTVHTLLREDVFAGYLAKDMNRFARAERNAAALLEQRPGEKGNLRAWQGGMALYRAVLAHEAGQAAEFQRLYQQAREDFTDARQATSGNDGVLAIVGGSLAVFADRLPQEQRAAAWATVYESYKMLYDGQAPALDKMPVHLRGEVVSGIAMAAQRTGRQEEAVQYLDKMLTIMQGTPYEATARQWKSDPASASASALTCKSCHEAGRLSPSVARLSK